MDTFTLDFEKTSDKHPHEKKQNVSLRHWREDSHMDRFLSFLQKRVVVNGETSGWAPAGADK